MSFRDTCLNALHRLYRSDPWLQSLFTVGGLRLEDVEKTLDEVHDAHYFDTLPEWACTDYEKQLGIVTVLGRPIEDRRAQIRAKWIADGKVTLQQLQEVANSWRYGAIDMDFVDNHFIVKFISPLGIPADLDGLKATLEMVKPAHIAIAYVFMWLTWGDCLTRGTWGDALNAGTWENTKRLPTH